jgi:hypothetical protein
MHRKPRRNAGVVTGLLRLLGSIVVTLAAIAGAVAYSAAIQSVMVHAQLTAATQGAEDTLSGGFVIVVLAGAYVTYHLVYGLWPERRP